MNNNLNNFLLAIAHPIINELDRKNEQHSSVTFEDVCRDHQFFVSYDTHYSANEIDEKSELILKATADFLNSHCRCCDRDEENYKQCLLHYLDILLPSVLNDLLDDDSDFFNDYRNTLGSLLEGKIDIEQAMKSLRYWQDAVPYALLQQTLVQLAYNYIRQLKTAI